jgi:hypothetical protein
MDLQPATRQQLTLDLDADMPENRIRLMQAMDQLNQRYGRGTLKLASAGGIGGVPVWGMKQEPGLHDGLGGVGECLVVRAGRCHCAPAKP